MSLGGCIWRMSSGTSWYRAGHGGPVRPPAAARGPVGRTRRRVRAQCRSQSVTDFPDAAARTGLDMSGSPLTGGPFNSGAEPGTRRDPPCGVRARVIVRARTHRHPPDAPQDRRVPRREDVLLLEARGILRPRCHPGRGQPGENKTAQPDFPMAVDTRTRRRASAIMGLGRPGLIASGAHDGVAQSTPLRAAGQDGVPAWHRSRSDVATRHAVPPAVGAAPAIRSRPPCPHLSGAS